MLSCCASETTAAIWPTYTTPSIQEAQRDSKVWVANTDNIRGKHNMSLQV